MPIQHLSPERQTRTQAVLTKIPRAPLDGTPSVPQLRAQLDRGTVWKTIFKVPGEDGEEEEDNYVEGEGSYGTEGDPAPVGVPQGTGGLTLGYSDQPFSHQSEPSLLAIMQQMTQIMANLKAASSPESSRPPAFKIPSMKAPKFFDETQPFKVKSRIQS
ncbi:hypothetical protein O181_044700, partial [Austropuccinia psidii MF-1]|nr:hypothetical protein [Austropuccinia psidii MF-1]